MTESTKEITNTVRQLLVIAVLLGIGYYCNRMLRSSSDILNSIFACAFYAIPFLAIRPVRRLHKWPRIWDRYS